MVNFPDRLASWPPTRKIWALYRSLFGKRSDRRFGQCAEDAIIDHLVGHATRDGFYVDVGAYHPIRFSNTFAVFKRGWRGVNIDLDAVKIDVFRILRPRDHNVVAAVSNQESDVVIAYNNNYSLTAGIGQGTDEKGGAKPQYSQHNLVTNSRCQPVQRQSH